MKYTEEELRKNLEEAKTSNEMNQIRGKCKDSGLKWEDVSMEIKRLYAETQSKLFRCPDEYKANPQIHYDIPHFCRPKTEDDTTSQ